MAKKDQQVCEDATFASIFREQAEGLRNFLYYRCGNIQQAEDLVQEAFSKLWINCAKVGLEKSKSYLFTVAKNLFFNQVEHQKVVLRYEKDQGTSVTAESPQFILEEKEFAQLLNEAIANLPENQRIVFLMNRIDKKTYKEIAVLLDISVKAVEKRMHKALVALRKVYNKV